MKQDLTALSTAEISTGIICVCLPTLAAFTHRRSRGPSTSIVNGDSNTHRTTSSSRKQHLGLNDPSLFEGEYIELGAGSSQDVDLRMTAGLVVTGIRGGTTSPLSRDSIVEAQETTPLGAKEALDRSVQGMNIVKTVRIEQSHT